MDADVAELVRSQRLIEAATLAAGRGDAKTASDLYEKACAFREAAAAALDAGDAPRALVLAALAADDAVASRALERLVAGSASPGHASVAAVADRLRERGLSLWAARTYEAAGAPEQAAIAWERAGDRVQAARLLEGGGDGEGAARAAHVLEAGLRSEPDRSDLLYALGALLLRCGKPTPALRALQRVATDAPEKGDALELSLRALTELGMMDAKAEVVAQLTAMGRPDTASAAPSRRGPQVDASDLREPRPAVRLYGRYEVVREVSSTATARLLECRDVLRGERVAVKLFAADSRATRGSGRDALAHFVREARALAQLAHPNVVPLRDILEQGPALVLEWMPGGTLEEHLATRLFTPARAADVACAVLTALGEAHRLGVVHRDLKPANILFDASGTARLSDFGVAHLGDLSVTATAGSFGSLAYMSPEQREGRPATAQSDIFSLGVILLEMLTGRRVPMRGRDDATLDEPLSSVHRYLEPRHDAVVARLVARDATRRPPDAFTAARGLAELPWPSEPDADRAVLSRPRVASVRPLAERLELLHPDAAGHARDRWLDRDVACVPLTPSSLARAAVFARVGHRALQPVLRVDRDAGTLWLGVPRGDKLARPLEPAERVVLAFALAKLADEGFVHGSVSRDAVVVGADGPVLLFSAAEASGGVELDQAAFATL